jgi:hypothetical protein
MSVLAQILMIPLSVKAVSGDVLMGNLAQQLEPNLDIYPNIEPLPDMPPVEKWDDSLVPEVIRDYVKDAACRMKCLPDFVAVAAVVGLAGVVGTNFRVRPKKLDTGFEIVPNLWGALIGRPSSMKSPTLGEGLKPISKLQEEARKDYEMQKMVFEVEKDVSEMSLKLAKDAASKALKNKGESQAKSILEAARSSLPEAPTMKRYTANDATVAKLGELLRDNPNGLILVRDELSGWLADMQSESKQADRAFYLECFNGNGSYTVDRIERGTIHIPNACVSIIGGIQPSKLASLVRGAVSGTSDDGLLQRFQLAVWPDALKGDSWVDRRVNERALENFTNVYRRLAGIEIEQEEPPIIFSFDDEAQAIFIEWWNELGARIENEDIPPALESHLIKMKKTVPSLALIFSLVSGADNKIDKQSLLQALGWYDYLMSHANRIYGVGISGGVAGAKTIIRNKAKIGGSFSARDIYRKGWSGLSDKLSVDDALSVLVDHCYLMGHEVPSGDSGGRSTKNYTWNPKVGGSHG